MFTVTNVRGRIAMTVRNAYELTRMPRWMSFVTEIQCPWCGTFVPPGEFPKMGPACRKCVRRKRNRATIHNRYVWRTRRAGGVR